MSLLISYDLRAPGRNYDGLYRILESFNSYARINESFWVIETSLSPEIIRDELKKVLDKDDRIFVTKYSGPSAWLNSIDSNDKVRTVLRK